MEVSFEIENRALIFYMVDVVRVCDFLLLKLKCIIFPQFICISHFVGGYSSVVFTLEWVTRTVRTKQ